MKLWKRCVIGSDKVIGFISLHLPPTDVGKAEYEMSNLSVSDQAPLITVSIYLVAVFARIKKKRKSLHCFLTVMNCLGVLDF